MRTIEQLTKAAKITKGQLTDDDLALINQFTLEEIEREKIFAFKIVLCDNEVDRDCEAFTINALNGLASLFVGKTGIKDHSMRSSDQIARIYKTEVIADETKQTSYGEQYAQLIGYAYIVKTSSTENFIDEIKAGIKREVSVSCALASAVCSICGNDRRIKCCEHKPGHEYNGVNCFTKLDDPVDAYEFSFVAVPAQRAAGVSKSAEAPYEREPYKVLEPENNTKPSLLGFLEKAFSQEI